MKRKRRSIKRRKPAKRRVYRNPSKKRSYKSRAVSRVKSTLMGMNFKTALKNVPAYQIGMWATKWAVKRLGPAASLGDSDSWDWTSYLKGVAGAVGAGVAMNMVKPGWGQKVFEGGINYLFFQLVHNKVIAQNEWAAGQFGEDDYYPDEYLEGANEGYVPGDVESGPDNQPYLLGADYQWHPTGAGQYAGVGDVLQPVGPLGDVLQPVGPLGNSELDNVYAQSLLS